MNPILQLIRERREKKNMQEEIDRKNFELKLKLVIDNFVKENPITVVSLFTIVFSLTGLYVPTAISPEHSLQFILMFGVINFILSLIDKNEIDYEKNYFNYEKVLNEVPNSPIMMHPSAPISMEPTAPPSSFPPSYEETVKQ